MYYLHIALLTETIPDDKQCQIETNYVGTVFESYIKIQSEKIKKKQI